MSRLSIGVDLGGTWLRVLALDNRRIKNSLKTRSLPAKKLPSFLKKLFNRWKIQQPDSLVVGAKGVYEPLPTKTDLKGLARFIIFRRLTQLRCS